jgi:hypothetical protein
VFKDGKGVTIVFIEAVLRAKPQKAGFVLQDRVHRVIRQAIVKGNMLKMGNRRLGMGGWNQQEYQT